MNLFIDQTNIIELNKMNNTCSMYELGGVSIGDNLSAKLFGNQLENLMLTTGLNLYGDNNKTIIYNTNYSWWDDFHQRAILRRVGFRKIGGYRGRNGHRVNIMLKKI